MVATSTVNGAILGKPLGLGTAHTSALLGLDAHTIRVEVCCSRGPSFFTLVGLAEAAVREARVRVASALARLGVLLDEHAITVNLAPAGFRKNDASLDVPIALAVLAALEHIPDQSLDSVLVLGELSLNGELRPIRGALPQLCGGKDRGMSYAIVPKGNEDEAGMVRGMPVYVATTLGDVIEHLAQRRRLPLATKYSFAPTPNDAFAPAMSEIRGQATARRALEIAAAGGHNLLLVGPPGGGKTLLARTMHALLPPLDFDEAVTVTSIHSVAGLITGEGAITSRPFRAPHHSVSEAGLVGGGELPRPGEISLAHHGVLFLDEFAEFRRSALEALRQPLEDGRVCISRARGQASFPASPIVVAAVNPCPCGYFGHPVRKCRCTDLRRSSYLQKLSGPLLDRLDIHVTVPPVGISALCSRQPAESSTTVAARVLAARQRQWARRGDAVTASCNAKLNNSELDKIAPLTDAAIRLLTTAVERLGLSARGVAKIRRVARTIADLEDNPRVSNAHLSEALQGRLLDRDPGL